eukprot:6474140-Amphidinium_carterae.1
MDRPVVMSHAFFTLAPMRCSLHHDVFQWMFLIPPVGMGIAVSSLLDCKPFQAMDLESSQRERAYMNDQQNRVECLLKVHMVVSVQYWGCNTEQILVLASLLLQGQQQKSALAELLVRQYLWGHCSAVQVGNLARAAVEDGVEREDRRAVLVWPNIKCPSSELSENLGCVLGSSDLYSLQGWPGLVAQGAAYRTVPGICRPHCRQGHVSLECSTLFSYQAGVVSEPVSYTHLRAHETEADL